MFKFDLIAAMAGMHNWQFDGAGRDFNAVKWSAGLNPFASRQFPVAEIGYTI
jgi:hypothetical protein